MHAHLHKFIFFLIFKIFGILNFQLFASLQWESNGNLRKYQVPHHTFPFDKEESHFGTPFYSLCKSREDDGGLCKNKIPSIQREVLL